MRRALLLLLGALACGWSCPAQAHDLAVVRAALIEEGGGRHLLDLRATAGPPGGQLRLPQGCAQGGPPVIDTIGEEAALRFTFTCEAPLGAGDRLTLPGGRGGAFVTFRPFGGPPSSAFFEGAAGGVPVELARLILPDRPLLEALPRYLVLGIEHILRGFDHLAFVLGLCLLARGWTMIRLITAFTVGHSLTLALAVFGLVDVPRAPVDACIALSIAIVARQALLGRGEGHGSALAFGFGLLHGLGFASALNRAGIAGLELVVGLIGFNLGVEVGQLLFIAVVLLVAWSGRDLPVRYQLRPGLAHVLGALGLFWLIQRVSLF